MVKKIVKHLEYDANPKIGNVENAKVLACVSDDGDFTYGKYMISVGNNSVFLFPCDACYAEFQSVLLNLFTDGLSDMIVQKIRRSNA